MFNAELPQASSGDPHLEGKALPQLWAPESLIWHLNHPKEKHPVELVTTFGFEWRHEGPGIALCSAREGLGGGNDTSSGI